MKRTKALFHPAMIGGMTALLCVSQGAHAAWVIQPSAEVRSGYEDNIRLDENEQSGFRNIVAAQARLSNVTETTNISLIGNLSYLMYHNVDDVEGQDDLDNNDQQTINLVAQRRSERLVWGMFGNYRRDILLRRTEFIPDGFEAQEDESGVISLDDPLNASDIEQPDIDTNTTTAEARRTMIRLNPNVRYEVTENLQAELGYNYYGLRYGSGSDEAGLEDSDTNGVYTGLRYRASPRDAVGVRVRGSKFDPDEGLETDTYEATVRWDRQMTERLSLGAEVGASRVDSDFDDDNGWLFSLDGRYRGEVSSFSATVARRILPGGYGDVVEADTINVGYSRDLGDRWSFGIGANGYSTENTSDAFDGVDRDFFSANAGINWLYSEDITFALGYSYDWVDRSDEPDSYSGNSVSLTIRYAAPSQL